MNILFRCSSRTTSAYYSKYAPYQPVSARESEVMSQLTDNTRRRLNDPSHPEKNDIVPWADASRMALKNREQHEAFLNIQPQTRNEVDRKLHMARGHNPG